MVRLRLCSVLDQLVSAITPRSSYWCSVSDDMEGRGVMTTAPISLQDLRRRLYVKAKAAPAATSPPTTTTLNIPPRNTRRVSYALFFGKYVKATETPDGGRYSRHDRLAVLGHRRRRHRDDGK